MEPLHSKRRIGVFEILICLVVTFVVAAILFPFFAKPKRGKDATVFGIDLKPMPNLKIDFEDGQTTTTDKYGRFDFPNHRKLSVANLAFVGSLHHTGGYPGLTFEYSPLVDYVLVGGAGAPGFDPETPTFEVYSTGENGLQRMPVGYGQRVVVHAIPALIRPSFIQIIPLAGRDAWDIDGIERKVDGNRVEIYLKVKPLKSPEEIKKAASARSKRALPGSPRPAPLSIGPTPNGS